MSKVTSKLQVTVPKAIADRFGIRPGDEIEWKAAGDAIRIERVGRWEPLSVEARLKLFDEATRRVRRRRWKGKTPANRGWTREELYERGRPR
ncbi:MAG: AbrB/MazE/SpoVT family DNA-binding domain-containing protein [Thermoanaerobaculia bacterium]